MPKATTILHVGDIHLKSGPLLDDKMQALEQVRGIVDNPEGHGLTSVDLAICTGDIFDGRSTPEERLVFMRWLLKMNCNVLLIKGNHDRFGDLDIYDALPHVHVVSRPIMFDAGADARQSIFGLPINILAVPWPDRRMLADAGSINDVGAEALLEIIRGIQAAAHGPTMLFGHLSMLGSKTTTGQPLIGHEIQLHPSHLDEMGFAYVGLGHIHKFQDLGRTIRYAGALTRNNFGEGNESPCVTAVTYDADKVTRQTVLTYCITFETVSLDVSSNNPLAPLHAYSCAGGAVRVRYECDVVDASKISHDEIRHILRDCAIVKIEPTINHTKACREVATEVSAASSLVEKLMAYCASNGVPEERVTRVAGVLKSLLEA